MPDNADAPGLTNAHEETVPSASDASSCEEWAREIERRVAELDAGTATTVPWDQVRDEALARIGHGKCS